MKRSTSRLDDNRRMVANRVEKFEKAAHEIHELADKMHKKMEQLHLDTMATRERARTARTKAEARDAERLKPRSEQTRKKAI